MDKFTFIIKTAAPRGPRSKLHETFVVVAEHREMARCMAVAVAHPGAVVTSAECVESVQRVHVGG